MEAGLHGSEVAEHPGLPSRSLAVFRSSPTQGPDSPRRSRSRAQLLCRPPLAPRSPSPAVCCSRGFRPPSAQQRCSHCRYHPAVLSGAILPLWGHWAASGDTCGYRDWGAPGTEGWGLGPRLSPPQCWEHAPTESRSGQNVPSALGQTRWRPADEGDDGTQAAPGASKDQ